MSEILQKVGMCILTVLVVAGCDDEETDQLDHQDIAVNESRPEPMPEREKLEIRGGISEVPTELSTGSRFELFSMYNGQDIRQVTGVSGRTLWLCFVASWCPKSADMIRELKQLASEEKGNVQVVVVDADAYPTLAEQFNITKVPTTFLYAENVKLRTIEGAYNAASLRRCLHRLLTHQENTSSTSPSQP